MTMGDAMMGTWPQEEHDAFIAAKRRNRMQMVDRMSPEIRKLVHDYGLNVVKAFMNLGVTTPRHIKHLVETVLDDFSPTRGSYSSQGKRGDVSGSGR